MRVGRSIRFRLSALYSAVVFGLGGLILALLYGAVYWQTTSQFVTVRLLRGELVQYGDQIEIIPRIEEAQVRTLESLFNQVVLERMRNLTLIALGFLFLLSLVVGWIIAGRALRPIARITDVARDIEASDLSRRIALTGPDDELKRLASTFDAMLDRLERAFTAQRRFLADTSHDLRTPLAAIRTNVEVALSDPDLDADEWRGTAEIVARNAERMSDMIDGLLATARLQNRQATEVEVDLAEVVEEATADVKAAAAERGVELEATAAAVRVTAEPTSLRRALDNLVDNALKASIPGATVRLAAGEEGGWAYLAVADQGPGFDPSEPGIGLGLSIVRQVAEGHGGTFQVHQDRVGSVCVIWLPKAPGYPPPAGNPLAGV